MAKIGCFVRFSKAFLVIFVRFSNISIVLPLPVSPLSGENAVLLIVNYCGYYLDLLHILLIWADGRKVSHLGR